MVFLRLSSNARIAHINQLINHLTNERIAGRVIENCIQSVKMCQKVVNDITCKTLSHQNFIKNCVIDEGGSQGMIFSRSISAVIKQQMAMAYRKDVPCTFEQANAGYGFSGSESVMGAVQARKNLSTVLKNSQEGSLWCSESSATPSFWCLIQ